MTAGWHVPDTLLERFATVSAPELPPKERWSAEAHLERCAACRARLADALATSSPGLLELVDGVKVGLDERLTPQAPPRRRLARRVAGGVLVSWLAACVAVLLAAALLDLAAARADRPSWVLLLAPALPLLGVAASWSRVLDPAYDLVAATPSAGLWLLLRRTLVVLAVIVPTALLAGVLGGTGEQAAWLLPCLALTSSALALAGLVGVTWATAIAALAWTAGIVVPALVTQQTPAALGSSGLPAWAALTLVAAGVIALRKNAYRRLETR